MNNLLSQFGTWAIVTGASSGIGKEFAQQLAAQGFNLILVARRVSILETLSEELAEKYGIKVVYKSVDLSHASLLTSIKQVVLGKDIGLLVSNAGAGKMGAFEEVSLDVYEKMLYLNTTAHLKLSHWYSQYRINTNKKGGIILVSSIAAFQGVPYASNYAASKAYVLGLAEALNFEFRKKNISVTALLPGPTNTPMITENPDVDMLRVMPMKPQSPERVAAEGLKAIAKNKPSHISGFSNRIISYVFPRSKAIPFWGNMMLKMLKNN